MSRLTNVVKLGYFFLLSTIQRHDDGVVVYECKELAVTLSLPDRINTVNTIPLHVDDDLGYEKKTITVFVSLFPVTCRLLSVGVHEVIYIEFFTFSSPLDNKGHVMDNIPVLTSALQIHRPCHWLLPIPMN